MITVFFNEQGYYITGENVNIARRCSPALTDRGDRVFQPIHHQYKVLFLALKELFNTSDDIMVYNHSRIIDEINGLIEPLDSTCKKWVEVFRRHTLPQVRALVFFRKKCVDTEVESAHDTMLSKLPVDKRLEIAREMEAVETSVLNARNKRIIERLKDGFRQKQ